MPNKIGLMVGREWSFPPAFVEAIKRKNAGWEVEYVKLGTPAPGVESPYPVIVDRISHAVPFYRSYLKQISLTGVRVVNDPFVEETTDRFLAATVAANHGISTVRRMALPHREYAEGIIHEESLRNLDYPLHWQAVADFVGLPCLLKDARGHGEPRFVCHSVDELLQFYNGSGQKLLIAQEMPAYDRYVRCFVIGDDSARVIPFNPGDRKYGPDNDLLGPELEDEIISESRRLTDALGLDINVVDWAIRDGEARAVELLDPTPEIDIYGLGSERFEWVVDRFADLVIDLVTSDADDEEDGDLAEELPSLARDLPPSQLQ